jgi:hypothetical protein
MQNINAAYVGGAPEMPLEPDPIGECEACGVDVYAYEASYAIDGRLFHVDCMADFEWEDEG